MANCTFGTPGRRAGSRAGAPVPIDEPPGEGERILVHPRENPPASETWTSVIPSEASARHTVAGGDHPVRRVADGEPVGAWLGDAAVDPSRGRSG